MLLSLPAISALIGGCSPTKDPPATTQPGAIRAFVTILPQVDFVRRIAGDARVESLVGQGQSHHTYEPTPRQMAELAAADIYFSVGVPSENSLLNKIASLNPNLLIVDTTKGITFLHGTGCSHAHHPDDAQGNHDHHHASDRDPHVWLDPRQVRIIARNIRDGLCTINPGRCDLYTQNTAGFESQLSTLHQQLTARLAPYRGSEFIVFHPAYGYFADAYGLRQIAVEADGKEPSARQIATLIDLARDKSIRHIFVQPQFASAGAAAIASAIGGKTIPLDPMTGDYLHDMTQIAKSLVDSFEQRASSVRR